MLRDKLVGAVDKRDKGPPCLSEARLLFYFQCIFPKYLDQRLDSFRFQVPLLQCIHSESALIKTELLCVWRSSLALATSYSEISKQLPKVARILQKVSR